MSRPSLGSPNVKGDPTPTNRERAALVRHGYDEADPSLAVLTNAPRRPRIGSLCSGYGGLDLAVEHYFGADTAWFCEYDDAPSHILAHHWPDVPNHRDITAIKWWEVEPVDILTAGFPCQPFSHAGKRRGVKDDRHLWPYIVEAIRALRPRYVVLENVRGLISSGGLFDEPQDRCVCGWTVGRGGLRPADNGEAVSGSASGLRDDREGAADPDRDAGGVRRHADADTQGDREMGRGLGVEASRSGGRDVPAEGEAVPAAQDGAGRGRVSGRGVAADAAGVFSSGSPEVVGRGVGRGAAPTQADRDAEQEGAEGEEGVPAEWGNFDCLACGRRVDGPATRSVQRYALNTVIHDLSSLGYDARWGVVRAADAGAAHGRARIFIVARNTAEQGPQGSPERRFQSVKLGARCEPAADASGQRHGRGQDRRSVGRVDGEDAGQARQRQRSRGESEHRGGEVAADATGAERRAAQSERVGAACGSAAEFGERAGVAADADDAGCIEYGRAIAGAAEHAATELGSGVDWGVYTAAITRWAGITGRPAPAPTEPGRNGNPRLSPLFVEWLMGLPEGHVTNPAIGLTRNQQLKALGNGVVPQQAVLALGVLV